MMTLRKALLAACAVVALAGCSAASGPAPQWSAQPQGQYYYDPPPNMAQRQAPAPYPYYRPPPRRYVPLPPAGDEVPDQAQIAPPVMERPSPPPLVPMDPDCGWWDPCHLWMGS